MSLTNFFKTFNKIVLCAGHGGGDPGAVNGSMREADHNIYITDRIAKNLRDRGITVDVVPHNLGLADSIAWVNRQSYPAYSQSRNDNAWVIEIHRDANYPQLPQEQKDNQMGVYYFDEDRNGVEGSGDGISFEVGKALADKFIALGAYKGKTPSNLFDFDGTWVKDHYLNWAGFNLGWLENTRPLAHLIEHGYMSGNGSADHLNKLADWTSQAIFETFTGRPYNNTQPPQPPTMTYEQQFLSDNYKLNRICEIQKFDKDGKLNGGNSDLHIAVSNNDLAYLLNTIIELRKNGSGSNEDTLKLNRLREINKEFNDLLN